MKTFSRILSVAALAFLPLPACATAPTPAIEGKVIEEGTNKPIPGAIVVARWQESRSGIFDSQTVCVHVESATTDEQGRYHLPRYKGKEPTHTDSYKAGYERSPQYSATQAFRTHTDILKPSHSSPGERLDYLVRLSGATRCGEAGKSEQRLLPLKRALYAEASAIGTTAEDAAKVETLLFGLESLELGSMEALNRMTERRKSKK